MSRKTKYIFVVGGVMSGVGKGTAAASIGRILQTHGFEVTSVKIDPYINVDAGTMNPTEHGEVFVLDDGMECDQDMGNYERFLNRDLTKANYMTTGSIYQSVINKERNLEYGGHCVEVVPHIPLEVISRLKRAASLNKADIVITEIGGTVGEYQNILFLEAIRILKLKDPDSVLTVLVSFLPALGDDSELKTKPTQYAVRSLNAVGLHPNIILARAPVPLDRKRKEKIAFNCSVPEENVISAPNVKTIYDIPMNFRKENIDKIIFKTLKIKPRKEKGHEWAKFVRKIKNAKKKVKIGIVGKYFTTGKFMLADSYISVIEAVKHAAYSLNAIPEIEWLNAEELDPVRDREDVHIQRPPISNGARQNKSHLKKLSGYDGIIIPGGFGARGVEGKIAAIKYCRVNKIPLFGLCYGMQLSAIEFARDIAGMKGANTTEVNPKTKYPIIDILPEQKKKMAEKDYGGSMRLGSYPAVLKTGSIARHAYGKELIHERHRHRYEVNPEFIHRLEKKGLVFSGSSKDRRLMEILELPRNIHPFFLGTQFHPEFKSRPLAPHPLFVEFIKASLK